MPCQVGTLEGIKFWGLVPCGCWPFFFSQRSFVSKLLQLDGSVCCFWQTALGWPVLLCKGFVPGQVPHKALCPLLVVAPMSYLVKSPRMSKGNPSLIFPFLSGFLVELFP